jgi:hypothetical protein
MGTQQWRNFAHLNYKESIYIMFFQILCKKKEVGENQIVIKITFMQTVCVRSTKFMIVL